MRDAFIKTITGLSFLIIFGILGYYYFDYVTYQVNEIIWKVKYKMGIEQSRGLEMFKPLPAWANSAFGSIVGWLIRGLLAKIYVYLKEKFFSRKRRRRKL
jgi:hypothetical protein